MLVITAGIRKMLFRIANREDPDQTATLVCTVCLSIFGSQLVLEILEHLWCELFGSTSKIAIHIYCRLEATVASQPPPRKYKWTVDGREVVPSERTRIVREGNTIILLITPTMKEDEGEYILNVENELGEVTCRTTLCLAGQ